MLRLGLLASMLASGTAFAQGVDRDMFGLDKPEPPKAETCTDWRTFGCVSSTDTLDETTPFALRTWLTREYLMQLPTTYARHDSVAHYAIGASRDDAGPVFGGATGLENRWSIDGAPSDHMRTGGNETRVPLVFLDGIQVQAGGFAARDRTGLGGTIDAQLRRGTDTHQAEAFVWTGLSAEASDRPIASGNYSVRRLEVEAGADAALSLVATGPLGSIAGGKAWYVAGIAPSLQRVDFEWTASRLVDLDGDGLPDGLPGPLVLDPVLVTREQTVDYLAPMMARAGWARGAHALELSAIGHASRDTFMFANATQQAAGIDRHALVGDAIATYRGTWKDTRVRAQLAWHRSVRTEDAHSDGANDLPQLQTAYIPSTLPEDPALIEACRDPDPDDSFLPCPIPFGFFLSGGPGQLVDTTGDRPSASVDVAHRRGRHVLRSGLAFEDTRLLQTHRFSGGELQRSLLEGQHLDRQRFFVGTCSELEVGDPFVPCEYVDAYDLRYRTRYTAAYVEDTFSPGERVQVNAGLRYELMWVGSRLHLSDQLAPRLGVAWDVLGGGRSRVFASMGRSFAYLPAGLGPTVLGRAPTARDVRFVADTRNIDLGEPWRIAEDIQGASQHEVLVGVEAGLAKTVRFTAWAQGRWLERGLETTGTGFDNPGRDVGAAATRQSEVYAAELATTPTAKTIVRTGWMWGRTVGTWTGPFDPRLGATLYNSTDFDTSRETSANTSGWLPQSPGHRAFFELSRRGRIGSVELGVASRFTVASGRPRNVLGDTDIGVVYLLQRGAAGRLPMQSQVNTRLTARWRGTDLLLDVLNLLDRRQATAADDVYVFSTVRPIVNGTEQDLIWLVSESGRPPPRRTAFRLPTQFQSPLGISLGIRRVF